VFIVLVTAEFILLIGPVSFLTHKATQSRNSEHTLNHRLYWLGFETQASQTKKNILNIRK